MSGRRSLTRVLAFAATVALLVVATGGVAAGSPVDGTADGPVEYPRAVAANDTSEAPSDVPTVKSNGTLRDEQVYTTGIPSSVATNASGDRVRVVIAVRNYTDSRERRLESEGATIERSREVVVSETDTETRLQARINVSKVATYRAIPWVERVRRPLPSAVSTVSEGVAAIDADDVHASGTTGDGVTVGIIDYGFDVSNAEIEDNIAGYESFTADADISGAGDSAHGTAVAEIVVDTAPDADVYLANFDTETEYLDAASWLERQGVDVIVTSIGFYGQPYDGDGYVADGADDIVSQGVTWVNAAGNSADTHWGGEMVNSDGDEWLEFESGDERNYLNGGNSVSGEVSVTLSWNDWPTSDQDYDLYLYKERTFRDDVIVAQSVKIQNGDEKPYESLTARLSGGTYYLAVRNVDASGSHQFELHAYEGVDSLEYHTASNSIVAPATGDRVVGVGAYNVESGELEGFSSRGPTNDGGVGIDVAGPDGVTTSQNAVDCTLFIFCSDNRFYGTSAAAPHVGGVAGLVLDANPSLTPTEVERAMESTATDAGPTGVDYRFGHGRVNAARAVQNARTDPLQVDVRQVSRAEFPQIEVFATVSSGAGEPVEGLTERNFSVAEDGTPQTVEAVEQVGNGSGSDVSVALAIDRSGSMDEEIDQAEAAAREFVDTLRPDDEATVISFGDDTRIDQRWTRSKTELRAAIDFTAESFSTELYGATVESVRQAAPRTGRSAVIVLTDGQSEDEPTTLSEAISVARDRGVPVYTIGLGSIVDETALRSLASETGGEYYFSPTASELGSIYRNISQQISNEYRITYTTTNLTTDGGIRDVRTTALHAGASGSDTGQYTAPCAPLPTAAFAVTTNGRQVTLDAGASTPNGGEIVAYRWDVTNDGQTDATGRQATHTYADGGTYEVKLTVEKGCGVVDTRTRTVVVRDPAGAMNVTVDAPDRVATGAPTTINVSGDPAGQIIVSGPTSDWTVTGTNFTGGDPLGIQTTPNSSQLPYTAAGGTNWSRFYLSAGHNYYELTATAPPETGTYDFTATVRNGTRSTSTSFSVEVANLTSPVDGVSAAVYAAATGADGSLSRDDLVVTLKTYIRSGGQSVRGVPADRSEVVALVRFYIQSQF